MKNRSFALSLVLMTLALILSGSLTVTAQTKQEKEVKVVSELSADSAKSLDGIMAVSDKAIPKRLLKDAKAIAVFPSVIKAAFIFGGKGGKGLISRKLKSGWSAPAVFKLAGGGAGFQIGGSQTQVVLLFMSDDSLENLLKSKFKIGGDAAAAAGPVGRSAEASTDARLEAEILSYSKSKGLFAGISIDGAVLSPDNDANKAVYGLEAKELLTGTNKVAIADIPAATKSFQQSVTRHAP